MKIVLTDREIAAAIQSYMQIKMSLSIEAARALGISIQWRGKTATVETKPVPVLTEEVKADRFDNRVNFQSASVNPVSCGVLMADGFSCTKRVGHSGPHYTKPIGTIA